MTRMLPETIKTSSTTSSDIIRNAVKVMMPLFIFLLLVIALYPIVWLLLASVKSPHEFSLRPIYALPEGFYFQNYVDAWSSGKFNLYFANSVLVTIPSLLLVVGLSVSTAFGIEIMRWRIKNGILLLFLAGILIPGQMVLLPLYTMFYRLNLLDNRWGLIAAYTAFGFPLSVFFFVGYFKSLSHEILEAAIVDGANIYQVFFYVALPMIRNSIFTIGLIQFFFIWNDLLLSLTFISNTKLRTVQAGLLDFVGRFGERDWGPTFASISMSILPTLLIYLILNRFVIRGLTAGAVKG